MKIRNELKDTIEMLTVIGVFAMGIFLCITALLGAIWFAALSMLWLFGVI
jgi:hypothetical protein